MKERAEPPADYGTAIQKIMASKKLTPAEAALLR